MLARRGQCQASQVGMRIIGPGEPGIYRWQLHVGHQAGHWAAKTGQDSSLTKASRGTRFKFKVPSTVRMAFQDLTPSTFPNASLHSQTLDSD
ncbi:uncharacterized protein LOC116622658 isoform X5 [Phoca vitulina]|uniref:uncharacterized protein LOC116622658 isoform X5 n=1 Tax=Phoca vitulina TaxID=9720 RepID=UPI001395D69C|nr:uncharacterized protein LOC116622658 isoform X5 [Phoca vitulina]